MTTAIQLITCLYAILARLYPHSFRAEFEEEMQVVFEHAVSDAANLLKMAGYFAAYMLMCGALVIGPLWGWALWERGGD